MVARIVAAMAGLVFPGLRVLYDYAWFVGFGVAALVYYLSMPAVRQLDLSVVPLGTEDER